MGSSTGDLLVDKQEHLERIFGNGQRLIAVHAEDETRIQDRTRALLKEGEVADYALHSQIRDPQTALIATERALALSEKYGRRLHILHLSTSEEVERLRRHKPDQVTCEVIPNHLFLNTDDYAQLGSRVQMNPPIRNPANASGLWSGLHQGIIDIIATDHAPHTLAEKSQPYPNSPAGMPGVETSLPLMLTAMQAGQCTLAQVQQWMCSGPAQVYGIKNKGQLAEDFDADLALVDIETTRPVRDNEVFSRAAWSPYAGRELTGWPNYTIVGGQVVFDNGQIRPGVFGKALEFARPG
jgi:dihydroorotase